MKYVQPAYEMQKFTKPLSKRFFYAIARWAAIVLALASVGFVLTGCDSTKPTNPTHESKPLKKGT